MHPRSNCYHLSRKSYVNFTGDSVQWTDWTSKDGTLDGKDTDGISYIKPLISAYTAKYPDPNDRVGIFWAGGSVSEDDFGDIEEFMSHIQRGKAECSPISSTSNCLERWALALLTGTISGGEQSTGHPRHSLLLPLAALLTFT